MSLQSASYACKTCVLPCLNIVLEINNIYLLMDSSCSSRKVISVINFQFELEKLTSHLKQSKRKQLQPFSWKPSSCQYRAFFPDWFLLYGDAGLCRMLQIFLVLHNIR